MRTHRGSARGIAAGWDLGNHWYDNRSRFCGTWRNDTPPFPTPDRVRNGRSRGRGTLGKAGEHAEEGSRRVPGRDAEGRRAGAAPGEQDSGQSGAGRAHRQVPVRRRRRGARGGSPAWRAAERRTRGGAAAGLPGGNGVSSARPPRRDSSPWHSHRPAAPQSEADPSATARRPPRPGPAGPPTARPRRALPGAALQRGRRVAEAEAGSARRTPPPPPAEVLGEVRARGSAIKESRASRPPTQIRRLKGEARTGEGCSRGGREQHPGARSVGSVERPLCSYRLAAPCAEPRRPRSGLRSRVRTCVSGLHRNSVDAWSCFPEDQI